RCGLNPPAPEVESALGGDGDRAHEQLSAEAGVEIARGGDHSVEDSERVRAARDGVAERNLGNGHAGDDPLGGERAGLLDGPEAEQVLVARRSGLIVPMEQLQMAPPHTERVGGVPDLASIEAAEPGRTQHQRYADVPMAAEPEQLGAPLFGAFARLARAG